MRGYPKHLNTKADYEYVIANFPKKKWRKDFEELLRTEKVWEKDKTLDKGVEGKIDNEHRVIKDEDGNDVQMKLVIDPNSKMKKLGYSRKEIEKILS